MPNKERELVFVRILHNFQGDTAKTLVSYIYKKMRIIIIMRKLPHDHLCGSINTTHLTFACISKHMKIFFKVRCMAIIELHRWLWRSFIIHKYIHTRTHIRWQLRNFLRYWLHGTILSQCLDLRKRVERIAKFLF